jgi:hypothetical protein
MENEDENAWEHISKPLTRALCSIALHKFTEPHQAREFESVECVWCKRGTKALICTIGARQREAECQRLRRLSSLESI